MTTEGVGRVYVYSAPGYDTKWTRTVGTTSTSGRGRLKVGWTGRHDSSIRVREQTGTVYPDGDGIVIFLDEPAVREDGTPFTDHDVHKVLDAAGVHRSSEVVEATLAEVRAAIVCVRRRTPFDPSRTDDFGMRPEQAAAVDQTSAYFAGHADDAHPPRYLWNAKMRFGKTFTTYQLARRLGWKRILVLTYKPAVRSAWRDDLANHIDFAGWEFADRDTACDPDTPAPLVWFASFQDLLGTTATGEVKEHNEAVHLIDWDCVVLDEYHFGAWQGAAKEVCAPTNAMATSKAEATEDRVALEATEAAEERSDETESGTPQLYVPAPGGSVDTPLDAEDLRLSARNYLYLSGTPFRALTEGEFNEDAIYNWTYTDEQTAKRCWAADHPGTENPYLELPQMQMFTYALSEMASVVIDQGADGLFDLSGFFEAQKVGSEYHFTDPARVGEFLNMLRGRLTPSATEKLLTNFKPPFPYANADFAAGVEHTVWFMPTVASAHAMKAALDAHQFFRDYDVYVAAGPGAKMGAQAKKPVDDLIARATKANRGTITLSCGKLMTGVTVPQWGAILILRSLKSPESYFQAAFRVQSPWTTRNADGTTTVNKDTCYVFDFDPNRALTLIYQYGTKLAAAAADATPSDEIRELIEFLPIFAFDGGRMDPVDVDDVMNWGTAGTGAAMLAKRWGSPRLIDLSEAVLTKLLGNTDLLDRLEQMEDFRSLRQDVTKIIASSQRLKETKAKAGKGEATAPEVDAARKAKREQVRSLRDKLLKFVQAIPVFMYLTDYREEALVDVIESLDTQLFERVTGLTLDDFHKLAEVGVFQQAQMDEAIWQFRLFEKASLDYLGAGPAETGSIGLWSTTVDLDEMNGDPGEG